MPKKRQSSESETSSSCACCGDHVQSTSKRPFQKSQSKPKIKVQSHNSALSARIRGRKFMIGNVAYRAVQAPNKRRRAPKRWQKKRGQRARRAAHGAEGNAPKTTPRQGISWEESELSPLCRGFILGLNMGTELNQVLASGTIPPNLIQKIQSLIQNPAQQIHPVSSADNLSQAAQVIEVPSGSVPSQQPSLASLIINQSQTAPGNIMPGQIPIPEDDPLLKPDEDLAKKTEDSPNENED